MEARVIRVIHYGLGPIGLEAARLVLSKPSMKIVGAVDIAKEKVGKDLATLLGLSQPLGIVVTDKVEELFLKSPADIVIHTTTSFTKIIYSQLEQIIKAKMNIVSSSEELLFPALQAPELAHKLDVLAKQKGVTILGTGVNPGFVMDTLPVCLTGVCTKVSRIEARRVVDASTRRGPLQRKIGAGLTEEEFRTKVAAKKLGHVGLLESVALIAAGMNWKLDDIRETIDPMPAQQEYKTDYVTVAPGRVAGIKQIAQGTKNGASLITLDLRMYIGAENPHDYVKIEGTPPIEVTVQGGVAGDQATVAALVNAVPLVIQAPPGLKTMLDIPVPRIVS